MEQHHENRRHKDIDEKELCISAIKDTSSDSEASKKRFLVDCEFCNCKNMRPPRYVKHCRRYHSGSLRDIRVMCIICNTSIHYMVMKQHARTYHSGKESFKDTIASSSNYNLFFNPVLPDESGTKKMQCLLCASVMNPKNCVRHFYTHHVQKKNSQD